MTGRQYDDDVLLVADAWHNTSAGITMMVSDQMRASDVLDALVDSGRWIRVDPDEPHLIDFRQDGWTIQHPLRCRPNLFDCPVNRVAGRDIQGPPAAGLGTYECGLDADGALVMEYPAKAPGGAS